MAYLCALLEQHPFDKSKPLSHKFEVIRLFLEDVVHVVPFESILYAIANCSHDTAMSCFQALKSYQPDLPISQLMDEGLNLANWRMALGFSGSTVKQLEGKADFNRMNYCGMVLHGDSNEVHLTQVLRPPGQLMPHFTSEVIAEQGLVTASVKRGELEFFPVTKECKDAAKYLNMVKGNVLLCSDQQILSGSLKLLCGLDIDTLYPTSISHDSKQQRFAALRSPLSILSRGREQLCTLLEETQHGSETATSQKGGKINQKMLKVVNNIRRKEVDTCTSLLGAYMQQQEIDIVL